MKHFTRLLLFLSLVPLHAQQRATSPIPTDDANTRKARAVMDKMISALGGNAYLNLKDMEQQGRSNGFSHGEPVGTGVPFWRFYKYPDKDRIELTKQRDWIIINNGPNGYELTFRGTRPQDANDLESYLRRRRYALDHVLRGWLTDPSVALFDDGTVYAEGKQAEEITIVNVQNESVALYVDSITSLPIKKSFSWRDPVDKQKDEEIEIYDAYRLVQGIQTPHNLTRMRNGEMQNQRFLFKVAYNQDLPDALFEAHVSASPGKK